MATSTSTSASSQPLQHAAVTAPLPRITIQFCTQCKWMLRAAYFAQELLSTFSLSLGEVALQPSTGGTFIVTIHHLSPSTSTSSSSPPASVQSTVLWDRKTDGGFPETKELKRRVRDVIDPSRDLGHVDRNHRAAAPAVEAAPVKETAPAPATEEPVKQEQASSTIVCEDCT
ncbi:rdx family domain-containing protein [Trichoderma breve]|uniref:Rdx family domain-containing protein n=1 Tax=Trichoderma breve TaxID=2034170 RepID=A0A9W9BHC7_9HYPO|nr:rdx family domain-containing protein [Trichoderma breve]KAJ4860385.1 rdx family domain-containing protein [Trichoderma breve]